MKINKKYFLSVLVILLFLAIAGYLHFRSNQKTQTAGPASKEQKPLTNKDQIYQILRSDADGAELEARLLPYCEEWLGHYKNVLERLKQAGYKVTRHEDFDPASVGEKIAYMRHDIHYRDIVGGACMMIAERQLGMRASYYLLWDYDDLEVSRREDYLLLRKLAADDHRFGLHYSLVDEYFYWRDCKGSSDPNCLRETLKKFMSSPDFLSVTDRKYLQKDPHRPNVKLFLPMDQIDSARLREMLSFSIKRLEEHLANLNRHFGKVETVAAHSGVLGTLTTEYRKVNSSVDTVHLSSSHHLLSTELLKKLNLKHEPYQLVRQYNMKSVTDSSLKYEIFDDQLKKALGTNRSFSILIHPSVWERGLVKTN